MKTLKYLKRAKISFAVFVFFGFLSALAFFLHSRTFHDLFLTVGLLTMLGWAVNPLPVIFSILGIRHYLSERQNAEVRESIGRRWLMFPAIMLGSLVFSCLACCLIVALTGGV